MEKILQAFCGSIDRAIKETESFHVHRSNSTTCLKTCKDGNSNRTKVVPSLLPEIIADILSRLPIEDVIRYKIVCKSWYSLTKDSHFICMHWRRSLCLPSRLILEPKNFGSISSLYLIDRESDQWRGRRIPVGNIQGNYKRTVCSCHGFLCVASSDSPMDPLLIYNPITRESMQLPETNVEKRYSSLSVGFGFDHINEKYKVVQFFKLHESDASSTTYLKGEIITLGEISWRKLEVFQIVLCNSDSPPVLLDGALYWIIDKDSHLNSGILVLDLCSEKFRTIKFPSNLVHSLEFPFEVFLLNLGGILSLIEHGYCERFLVCRIVPSENKVGYEFYQSYYKMNMGYKFLIGNIALKDRLSDNNFMFHVRPSNLGEERKINEHFALYDPQQDKHQIVESSGFPSSFESNLFIPSLLSPCAFFVPKQT